MELTIEQALQQGVTAHREGKVQEAERLYRAILHSQPTHLTLSFLIIRKLSLDGIRFNDSERKRSFFVDKN